METNEANDKRALLDRWSERLKRAQIAQYAWANQCSQTHYWLGIPAVVLGTLSGTAIFADFSELGVWQKVTAGLAGLAAALLAALQTFFTKPGACGAS